MIKSFQSLHAEAQRKFYHNLVLFSFTSQFYFFGPLDLDF